MNRIPMHATTYHFAFTVLVSAWVTSSLSAAGPGALPPQVAEINASIEQQWRDYEIKPAPDADDATWCRRVYLDVIGRIPSLKELSEFVQDRSADKRSRLVDKLLEDDRYAEEYAGHWATVWANVLIGRSGGQEQGSLTNRDGMMKFLRDSFAVNKPYNQMVYELVTAEGTTKPGTEGFNGATNFLADKVNDEDGVLATSSTARIFLGLQVQCTQCHNHPFNQWKQQRFWDFNAFFRQTRALRRFVSGTNDIAHAELVNEDFAGQANDPSDALIFYELRNGLVKTAYPVFIDDTAIGVSGYVSEVNRRQELGKLMLASPYLDKMMVNRFWGHFLGHAFTKPVDDLGPHNAATHPDLLEYLAGEVRNNSYDVKELIRWITLSRPYQLSAKHTTANEVDDPSVGETPKFSHFYLRQMTAEQLYQSMVTASGATAAGSYESQEQQRRQWLQQFVVAFGTDEGDEATTFNGSIPQALMLFNGELTNQAISDQDGGFIKRVMVENKTSRDRVNHLFLAGLARRPSKDEGNVAAKLLLARGGNEVAMLQDMWWAIINSNEFIMQH
jgi:hypothetical protein